MDHASFSKYIENIYILKKCFSKHQDFVQHLTNFKGFFSNVFRSAKMAESDKKKHIMCADLQCEGSLSCPLSKDLSHS